MRIAASHWANQKRCYQSAQELLNISHKIKATNKCNKEISAYKISIVTSMTVLTRKPTAIYESPIFAQDLNSLQIQWVSAGKMTEDPLPKRK